MNSSSKQGLAVGETATRPATQGESANHRMGEIFGRIQNVRHRVIDMECALFGHSKVSPEKNPSDPKEVFADCVADNQRQLIRSMTEELDMIEEAVNHLREYA